MGYGVTKPTEGNGVSKPELIYGGHTFSEPFCQDLLAAKRSIVISCQKIKYKYTPRLLYLLRDLMTNGIEIVVGVKVAYGIEAQYDENLSVKCAIIDNRIYKERDGRRHFDTPLYGALLLILVNTLGILRISSYICLCLQIQGLTGECV